MTSYARWPSPLSMLVFVAGLVASVASGLWVYRTVGVYGGPILSGYRIEWNQQTGGYQLVHEMATKSGLQVRRLLTHDRNVLKTHLSGTGVNAPAEVVSSSPARLPFSTRNDGVIDAWATRDTTLGTATVEVSTRRNGKIDRWEQYVKEQLVRVDLDTNGNGKADRWMTYEGGILMDTFIDANEDGQADGPPTR